MLILKILGLLLCFFGFIISMAIANGLYMTIWLETDDAKEGKIFHSRQMSEAVRLYKQRNPHGRKHIQARHAILAALGFAAGALGCMWIMSL